MTSFFLVPLTPFSSILGYRNTLQVPPSFSSFKKLVYVENLQTYPKFQYYGWLCAWLVAREKETMQTKNDPRSLVH